MNLRLPLPGMSLQALAIMLIGAAGVLASVDASAQVKAALTAGVDDPGRAPYQASVRQLCFSAQRACDFSFPAVPAGKRLVVQHASGFFSTTSTAEYVYVALRRADQHLIALPTSPQGCGGDIACPVAIYVFNQAVQAVYGAAEVPVVRITKGDAGYPILNSVNPALPSENFVTLGGYLVDCASTPCQAILP